jgi:NTP pyrophosphatase (non-canonical NTP hydrolase)
MEDEKICVSDLAKEVEIFLKERDWEKYHNPKDLAISIAIESAELMEIFQWKNLAEIKKLIQEKNKIERIKNELADIAINFLSVRNTLGMDLSKCILQKKEENKKKYPIEKVKGNYKKYTELE